MTFYIVRFIRRDHKPDEEYYYRTVEEAGLHYDLFLDDDSELYSKIEITDHNGAVIKEMVFSEVCV